ncbi:MAG TPA: tetratricopeptide repeat protein [Usitatibacter sp.]|nr:tetratricopeptide repeat protein [Usitatibacter sp.]
MSLLLDALKRAEQEKAARRQEGRDAPAAVPAPMLREAAPARPAASLELQPLSSGPQAANAATAAAQKGDARAAQAAFQGKPANNGEGRGRGMIWATLGAVGVVAIAAAAYVWYSVSALTPRASVQSAPRPTGTPMPPAGGAPPAATPAAEAQLAAALSAPPVTRDAPPAPAPLAAAPAAPAKRAPAPREDAISNLLRDAAPGSAAEPLRLDRTAETQRRIPAEISAGYDALRQGNLATARRNYEAALATNPSNLDALLGLATIEARSGNRAAAALNYRRALDVDPRNATAAAGLATLADSARPDAVEAHLRSVLAQQPESAALHFTLGNALVAQSRWNEAQSEYFEAHRLDPGSPEIMHNLAVSLDRLGQPRVAAGFYRRALDAVDGRAAPFDARAVQRRLEELR